VLSLNSSPTKTQISLIYPLRYIAIPESDSRENSQSPSYPLFSGLGPGTEGAGTLAGLIAGAAEAPNMRIMSGIRTVSLLGAIVIICLFVAV